MKIKKSELERLIAEAVMAQGGNAKTQRVIVENVKRKLDEAMLGYTDDMRSYMADLARREGGDGPDTYRRSSSNNKITITNVHITSLKNGGLAIDAEINGEKFGPVKMSYDDVNSFSGKTNRTVLAKKYLLDLYNKSVSGESDDDEYEDRYTLDDVYGGGNW